VGERGSAGGAPGYLQRQGFEGRDAGMPFHWSSAETVSGKKTIRVWPGEEDVNRDKVGYPLAGLDGDRRVKLEAPAAHSDGADQAVDGQFLELERCSGV